MSEPLEWRTETWPVSKLKDWKKNPRVLTDKGMHDLEQSLTRIGYVEPIAINTDGTILGGHARRRVLKKLGIKDVDVRIPSRTLTDKEIEECNIRLNKNIAGEFDFDVLANQFETADLIDWGFSAQELSIDVPLTESGLTDPDETPELTNAPITTQGDVWLLGSHRLMCGDSTIATHVETLLDGITPLLMVTDPPYGVEYDASWRNDAAEKGLIGQKKSSRAIGKVMNDEKADWREAWALFPGDVAYVWHAGIHAGSVADSLNACGFDLRAQIIWAKNNFAISRGHYHWQHEPCWYAVKQSGKGHWHGDRKQTTLWHIDKPLKSETGHSTQKPVECMKRPIENNSSPGQAVYEPFSGSGTTIIAAETTGRVCLAMELNPAYVDMAITRWQNFTGKEAVHAATGETFNYRVSLLAKDEADPARMAGNGSAQ